LQTNVPEKPVCVQRNLLENEAMGELDQVGQTRGRYISDDFDDPLPPELLKAFGQLDHLLVAQARVEGLVLVTHDEKLIAYNMPMLRV
jgi:hypothetical protein